MVVRFILFILFTCNIFGYSIPEQKRESYARKMNRGFLLQSIGKTREAFYTFKEGYQEALQNGESQIKLNILEELFVWYRTHGYTAGVMTKPCDCQGEYRTRLHSPNTPPSKFPNEYESEWGNTPEQAKHIRQFMLGVCLSISGIFAVSISPPILGPYGKSMLLAGFTQMYLGLSNGYAEWEERTREIQKIEQKTVKLVDTK